MEAVVPSQAGQPEPSGADGWRVTCALGGRCRNQRRCRPRALVQAGAGGAGGCGCGVHVSACVCVHSHVYYRGTLRQRACESRVCMCLHGPVCACTQHVSGPLWCQVCGPVHAQLSAPFLTLSASKCLMNRTFHSI